MDQRGYYSPYSDSSLNSSQRHPPSSCASDSLIGLPIHYSGGKFSRRTIRSEIVEFQQPRVGRKFAKVDRRPLDPPPVAWLRLYEVLMTPHGPAEQEIVDYEDLSTLGMICTVDLFPAPPPYSASAQDTAYCEARGNLTGYLVGGTSVEPAVVSFRGRSCLFFAFPDLAVRKEGFFSLRYRVFDIFASVPWMRDSPIQAEVYGGTFQVFSTRQFPGLSPSTELSKLLQQYGIKVTTRDRESRKRGYSESDDGATQSSLTTTSFLPSRISTHQTGLE